MLIVEVLHYLAPTLTSNRPDYGGGAAAQRRGATQLRCKQQQVDLLAATRGLEMTKSAAIENPYTEEQVTHPCRRYHLVYAAPR